jgi:hypothetical protein
MITLVSLMMMEQGKSVLARRELNTAYLVEVAASESTPLPLVWLKEKVANPPFVFLYFFFLDVPVEEDIIDEEEQQGYEEAEFPDGEDEMAGFIVDEEEMDENGQFVKCVGFCVSNFILCSNLFMSLALCKIIWYSVHFK